MVTKKSKVLLYTVCVIILLPLILYLAGAVMLDLYVTSGAKKLIKLDEQGRLSREYGYVWQEINSNKSMNQVTAKITGTRKTLSEEVKKLTKKILTFPSIAAIAELNSIKNLYRTIEITDRNGIPLARIQTTHTCVGVNELNDILIQSLLTTEDRHFHTRKKAYDYNALFRAVTYAALKTCLTLKPQYPRGSSTIHMQVARFLLMRYDSRGYAYAEKSLSRKLDELKLAQALRYKYSNDEILTTYINHCVTAGKNMRGYYDVSMKLFGLPPSRLNVAQSLYLARLVKWNRHVPSKIIHQIKASMPALVKNFKWSSNGQDSILALLDSLSFKTQKDIIPANSHLIDLANEYWKDICRKNGMNEADVADMDIADPESMIRRYGNLIIKLTLDYRLQKVLESSVKSRGFGPDTVIRTDIKIGSYGQDLPLQRKAGVQDTVRLITVLEKDSIFIDPSSGSSVRLLKGDTVVCNIRYQKKETNGLRRSCFYYKRDTVSVDGQYFAYAIMDSKTRELLAYYSKDKLGSRLRSLLVNRNPNGSSTAKPLVYALAYDLGVYSASDMTSDNIEIPDTCLWARTYFGSSQKPVGMTYLHSPENGGYSVRNHDRLFDGYDYIYNHLSNSNNIISVETMYRLSTVLNADAQKQSGKTQNLLQRLNAASLLKKDYVTGPSLFTSIASVCNGNTINDSAVEASSQRYSIVLGTLELNLYEQMHLFSTLYDGKIAVEPAKHPCLFVKSITMSGNQIRFTDSIQYKTVFESLETIRPVHLALHKRLISLPSDKLDCYDICEYNDGDYLSNFAKSGTTDDIIKPYYADYNDTSKTNYGLWNAVLRLNLTKDAMIRFVKNDSLLKNGNFKELCNNLPQQEILDVTLASIGECDIAHTGSRDGKTLHGNVSRSLLKEFGIACSTSFYKEYEQNLIDETADKIKFANQDEESDLSPLSRALIRLRTGFTKRGSSTDIRFEKPVFGKGIRLKGKNYREMLRFAQYMGQDSRLYLTYLERLKNPENLKAITDIIGMIQAMEIKNQFLKEQLNEACAALLQSAESFASMHEIP